MSGSRLTTYSRSGVILRIVRTEDSTGEIVFFMQSENYGITTVDVMGFRGNVKMILSLVICVDVLCYHANSVNKPPRILFY